MNGVEDVKVAVIGNVDSGKCFARDTAIMLNNGTTKNVQDIIPGDLLMGDDSTARKVLGVTHGQGQLYTVTQENSDAYIVNAEHILVLHNPDKGIVCMSVKEYLELTSDQRQEYKGVHTGIDFPEHPVITDSYIFGYSLGCGRFSGCIPAAYKYNSCEVREQLLNGFVKANPFLTIRGDSPRFVKDLVWLLRSLGYLVFLTEERLIIEKTKYTNINVTATCYGDYYGFELDGNQQFLLADFTVTHNSSLVGTLLCGKNDDGRGTNRELVMNYPHEKSTGQTSSVGYQIVGFRENGEIISVDTKNRKDSWPKIIKDTKKLITFLDLAGHEKYLKTTIHGISSNHPDYALILIEGRGVRGMTSEHIMLALSFGVPFVILITKVDLYTKEVVTATIERVGRLIKQAKKDIWLVREKIDLEIPLQRQGEKFIPVFCISNVTGESLDYFKEYLFRLPKRIDYSISANDPFELAVIEGFSVPGIGTVAHGFLAKGTIRVGDAVWVGPDSIGNYHKSKIRSAQFKKINVDFVLPGHHCTVCLPGIDRKMLKQSVYIIHEKATDKMSVRKFTANVKVLTSHPITIKKGYCPILNMDNIRAAARMIRITTVPSEGKPGEPIVDQEYLRGGVRAQIQFKFMYRPAYLHVGSTFVFREGRTCGFGKVISIDLEQTEAGIKPKARINQNVC